MDSTHVAPGKAHRLAVAAAFIIGGLALWFSSAHAEETCTVVERVLRDGIVSLPLPSVPPAALELTSLGTVDDPARNVRYSIWRVANRGTISYRAHLQAPNGERVPFLVRASSETTLRSDSLDVTVEHSLIVDNTTVGHAAIAATTFADPRVLTGSDCWFDGNPLYAGEHAGTLRISTIHGAVVAEIPGTADLNGIATGQPSGELWTLRGNLLSAYSLAGAEIATFTLPGAATTATSGRQRIVANAGSENLWVAVGPTLYRLTFTGQVLGSVTYGEEIREIDLAARDRLWVVLESDVHVVTPGPVGSEPIRATAHIELPASVGALAYDSYWGRMWVVAGNALWKYDDSGTLIDKVPLTVPQPIQQLASDGAGAMWASGIDRLFRLQADGSVAIEIEAFSNGAKIVDLVSDPADGTPWVASAAHIKHFGRDGLLVHDLLPATLSGGPREIRFLELFADRTSPGLSFIAPVAGSTISSPRPTLRLEFDDPAGRGIAEETLELMVGEAALPVDCETTSNAAVCVPKVDLPLGEITVSARVYDLAGNLSLQRQRSFTVGTVVRSVEGTTDSETAANAGSLSAAAAAKPVDRLFVAVTDQAGDRREQQAGPQAIDQLSLTISSPASQFISVTTRDLVIRGTFSGPADSSVTANGIVAAMSGGLNSWTFAVRVRLAPGQNVISVVAAAPGQQSVTHQIFANRFGNAPFRIEASATDGPAPLEVEFTVQRFDTSRIRRVEVDFESDGQADVISEASRVGTFEHQYLLPGSYTAVFRIITADNLTFSYEVPVIVNAAEDRDLGVRATWQRFRTALAASDPGAALECMMPSVAQRYSNLLTTLQSSLPQIVTSFSDIYPTGEPGLTEYVLTREVNGQPTAFLVYFARGADGVWRIAGM